MSKRDDAGKQHTTKQHHKAKRTSTSTAGKTAQQPTPASARKVALDVLIKVEEAGAYSNLQLNRTLQAEQLSRQDAALVTELVYGTISRKLTIDHWLSQFVAKGLHKLQPWVHQLLRMSLYQLIWLDRIPAHAVVNEAVKLAKKRGHQGISGMVNGVLRNVLRKQEELIPEHIQLPTVVETLSVRYSFPVWLVERWLNEFGSETTEEMLRSSNESPHSSIRVNTMKATPQEVLEELQAAGLQAELSPIAAAGINVDRAGNLAALPGFAEGKWSLQDESSMLVAEVLQPKPGMRVLDACAAPGGKSMHIGELMKSEGELLSNDLHEHKRKLIEEQAERLGLTHVKTSNGDAVELAARLEKESFDAVLLDAPCSGFGVIRRKPEIKWTKQSSDVTAIARVQSELLESVSELVKPGGVLVYSTCTIAKEENEEQIARFLAKHPAFSLDIQWPQSLLAALEKQGIVGERFEGQLQLLPHHANSDGFFIARLKKSELV